MTFSLRQILISLLSLAFAITYIILLADNAAGFGEQPLLVRGLLVNVAVLAALIAFYPLFRLIQLRATAFVLVVCVPAMLPALFYYVLILPRQAGEGIEFTQLQSSLISDSSSNGIVEIGFAYPIFTPELSFRNQELFTRRVSIFLRMVNTEGEQALFRGVRTTIPGQSLSVEATVRGMLGENSEYLFNPLTLPPQREVVGKVVFIISNVEDGASFTEALRVAQSVQLELRDPETGTLYHELPIIRD